MLLAKRVAWCCSFIAVSAISANVQAETAWTAVSGELVWNVNGGFLARQGIQLQSGTHAISGDMDQEIRLEITGESTMTVVSQGPAFDHLAGGALNAHQSIMLTTDGKTFELSKLSIRIRAELGKAQAMIVAASVDGSQPFDILVHDYVKPGFVPEPATFYLEASDAIISRDFAIQLDRPELEGKALGAFGFFAHAAWSGGEDPSAFPAETVGAPRGGNNGTVCDKPVGQDLIIGELYGSLQNPSSAQVNGIWYDSFSVGTTSCNIGDTVLTWQGSSGTVHPVIGQNIYRLMDGRFEQIGQSWLKHGFTVAAGNACGCGCSGPGGPTLHPGCSDPYGAGLNNSQNSIKPKFRVNPTTGVHFHGGNPGFTSSVSRRLMVRHTDLDPALNPGAQYFIEGQYVHEEDAGLENDNNNASYRPLTISPAGANEYTADVTGTTFREISAIRAWKAADPSVVETDIEIENDGLYIMAAKATDLGGDVWHYEYAVMNMNGNRGISSFSVPISPAANVTNIGFHDVEYHDGDGEGSTNRDGTDWPGVFGNGSVTWSMVDVGDNSNALLWGTLYNFRFDADVEPDVALGEVTLSCFRDMPGDPDSVTALTVVPQPAAVSVKVLGGGAPDLLATCTTTDVLLSITDAAETLDPASPVMRYRYDLASFVDVPLVAMGGGMYQGTFPPPSCGDAPQFYFRAESTIGTVVTLPGEAETSGEYLTANVGFEEVNTYLETDFEAGLPAGWTQEGLWNVSSTCSSLPSGACGDSDGSSVAYFGQTASCDFDTGVHTDESMFTPSIALPNGLQVLLTYCSAFERDTTPIGDWPQVRVTPNGQPTDVVDEPAVGAFVGGPPVWEERIVDLTQYAGQTITIEFNFDNVFPSNDEYLGWLIDNVSVTALEIDCIPGCSNPDGDMNIDGSTNGVDIQSFAAAMMSASTDSMDLAHGDFSGNGVIDAADVNDMVATLLGL